MGIKPEKVKGGIVLRNTKTSELAGRVSTKGKIAPTSGKEHKKVKASEIKNKKKELVRGINIDFIRAQPQVVKDSQVARGENPGLVDEILEADKARRDAIAVFEAMRAEQNAFSKKFQAADEAGRLELKAEITDLTARAKLSDTRYLAETKFRELLYALPNLVDPLAPVGKEEDFVVLDTIGVPRDFNAEGFKPKDHVELGKLIGAIDVERATKVSGSRFYYLTGVGALLEFALINYAIQSAVKAGFIPVIPPALVRPQAMEGTGFLGQAKENVFQLEKDELYLTGTSEVALAGMHMEEELDAKKLPLRYAGYSTCFRREAGSYGRDTKGIIRVHQFDKVEMFTYTKLEDAEKEHQRLLEWEKDFLVSMEIPFRVIDVATQDLGMSATRKFDCEAWVPTQGTYREVTSASNCTQFQAQRLQTRIREDDQMKYVATLNGTLVAIPRMIVSILENHQKPDGTINVPLALRPFLGMDTFPLV